VVFVALSLLFVARALYRDPHPDRLGFQRMGAAVLAGGWNEDVLINTYPPPFSVVMAPIAWAEQTVGDLPVRIGWGLGQLAALLYLTSAFLRALQLPPSLGLVAGAWLCSWRFIVGDLNSQNVTLFLEALVAGGVLQAAEGRARRGGRLLGVGASLKVWPGFAALGWWAGRARGAKEIVTGLLGGVGLTALATTALLGAPRTQQALQMWFEKVAPHFGGPELQNQAWKGLFLRALGPSSGVLPQLVALAVGVGVLGATMAWIAWRPSPSTRVSALDSALVLAVGLPCFPVAWYFYEISLIPILLAVLGAIPSLAGAQRAWVVRLLALGVVLSAVLDRDLVGLRIWSAAATCGNTLFGALAIGGAGVSVREAWRQADLRA
jgi:hypothetical protein